MSKPDRETPPGAISEIIRNLRLEEQECLARRKNRIGMAEVAVGSSQLYSYLLEFARDIDKSPYYRVREPSFGIVNKDTWRNQNDRLTPLAGKPPIFLVDDMSQPTDSKKGIEELEIYGYRLLFERLSSRKFFGRFSAGVPDITIIAETVPLGDEPQMFAVRLATMKIQEVGIHSFAQIKDVSWTDSKYNIGKYFNDHGFDPEKR